MKRGLIAALFAGAMLAATTASVPAQSFQSKPINFIVGPTPGGGTDIYARAIPKICRAV